MNAGSKTAIAFYIWLPLLAPSFNKLNSSLSAPPLPGFIYVAGPRLQTFFTRPAVFSTEKTVESVSTVYDH